MSKQLTDLKICISRDKKNNVLMRLVAWNESDITFNIKEIPRNDRLEKETDWEEYVQHFTPKDLKDLLTEPEKLKKPKRR